MPSFNPTFTPEEIANEIWKDIEGTRGQYRVSSLGRIKSFKTYRNRLPKIISQRITRCGYLHIGLHVGDKKIYPLVHKLVALAFLGEPPIEGMEVNHKKNPKTNNRVSNLEWVTTKQNHEHAAINGLTAKGERNGSAVLTEKQVLEIRALISKGVYHRTIAALYGIGKTTVTGIGSRKIWKHI